MLLQAYAVTKRFGDVTALDGVGLSLRAGEIVALCGENGSGKSTLARILSGRLAPDHGRIELAGETREFRTPRAALDAGVALVGQEPAAVPDVTVGENVMLARTQRSLSVVRRRRLLAASEPLLARVGLTIEPGMRLRELGPGELELVEVAKALASDPRLLILDEATTRLPDSDRFLDLVKQLSQAGLAIIFITHRLREVRRLSHRAVVLRDGRAVGGLGPDALTDERLSAMMVGRAVTLQARSRARDRGRVVLEVDGLRAAPAWAPCRLQVRAGEVVGLAGLVGSGRSELIETIFGLRPARGGTVQVDGHAVTPGRPADAIAAGISLVPEDRHRQGLALTASIERNLAIAAARSLRLVHRRQEGQLADQAISRLDIRCAGAGAEVWTLSGGNQQKVVLARALESRPRLLLLDEPTRGVDIGARQEIYGLIERLLADGMAILMASSDLVEVLHVCDRIVVLQEGRVAGELDREHATEEEIMLLATGGEMLDHAA